VVYIPDNPYFYIVKNTKRIQVSGKAAEKLQEIAAKKEAKIKAIREMPKQDLSKLTPVG